MGEAARRLSLGIAGSRGTEQLLPDAGREVAPAGRGYGQGHKPADAGVAILIQQPELVQAAPGPPECIARGPSQQVAQHVVGGVAAPRFQARPLSCSQRHRARPARRRHRINSLAAHSTA